MYVDCSYEAVSRLNRRSIPVFTVEVEMEIESRVLAANSRLHALSTARWHGIRCIICTVSALCASSWAAWAILFGGKSANLDSCRQAYSKIWTYNKILLTKRLPNASNVALRRINDTPMHRLPYRGKLNSVARVLRIYISEERPGIPRLYPVLKGKEAAQRDP